MALFLFSEILLFVPLCQFNYLFAQFLQLTCFLRQFIKEGKRFLLPVNGMDGLYTLIVVVPDTAELLIESGELCIIFLRFLINLYDLELSTEDTGEDKFGLVLHAGLFKHREEFFIFLTVQPHGVAIHPWISKHFVPRFIACLLYTSDAADEL